MSGPHTSERLWSVPAPGCASVSAAHRSSPERRLFPQQSPNSTLWVLWIITSRKYAVWWALCSDSSSSILQFLLYCPHPPCGSFLFCMSLFSLFIRGPSEASERFSSTQTWFQWQQFLISSSQWGSEAVRTIWKVRLSGAGSRILVPTSPCCSCPGLDAAPSSVVEGQLLGDR